jgi:hypothetical protein
MPKDTMFHICSKKECDFSTSDVTDVRCGKCASELITECPSCSNYITQGINVFCTKCGHSLKRDQKSIYETNELRTL